MPTLPPISPSNQFSSSFFFNLIVSPSLKDSSPSASASNSYRALHCGTFWTGEATLLGGRDGGRDGGLEAGLEVGVAAGDPQGEAEGVWVLLEAEITRNRTMYCVILLSTSILWSVGVGVELEVLVWVWLTSHLVKCSWFELVSWTSVCCILLLPRIK